MRDWKMGVPPLFKRTLYVIFLILNICGCTAKQVVPVSMVQPGDDHLTCADLKRQIAANDAAADKLLRDDKAVENRNLAKNVGGAVPGIGIFLAASTDLSNEEQVNARALLDRNERLRFLVTKNGCN